MAHYQHACRHLAKQQSNQHGGRTRSLLLGVARLSTLVPKPLWSHQARIAASTTCHCRLQLQPRLDDVCAGHRRWV